MPCRERVHAYDVHVRFDCLGRDFLGGLEQRPDVHVEAQVGERRCDHLLAAVVTVLAHLRNEDSRAPPFVSLESRHR